MFQQYISEELILCIIDKVSIHQSDPSRFICILPMCCITQYTNREYQFEKYNFFCSNAAGNLYHFMLNFRCRYKHKYEKNKFKYSNLNRLCSISDTETNTNTSTSVVNINSNINRNNHFHFHPLAGL